MPFDAVEQYLYNVLLDMQHSKRVDGMDEPQIEYSVETR